MAGPLFFGDSARSRARMPYIRNAGKSGLPKFHRPLAKRSIEAVLGKDPCGKHSLQVAAALLGNIW